MLFFQWYLTFQRTFQAQDSMRNTSLITAVNSGVATPGHTRTFARASPHFAQASEYVVHFGTSCILRHKNAPHTTDTHQILPILMLLIHLRVQHSLRDFPFKRLLCNMHYYYQNFFSGSPNKSRPYFIEGDCCNLMYI